MKIDMRHTDLVEKKLREEMKSIDREILMGILHKIQNVDINKIKQDAFRKGQDEGYKIALKEKANTNEKATN